MHHRLLPGTRAASLHSGHHACDTRARGELTHIATHSGGHQGPSASILKAGHYHFNGVVSVTTTVWKSGSAGVTLPLIGSCRNELYTMTRMRRKNA